MNLVRASWLRGAVALRVCDQLSLSRRCAKVPARRFASAVIAAMLALAPLPARALEASDLTGWWLAIDDVLPKLWKQGAIAPMEEIVQIGADGSVSDRVMNFWAGSHQVCFEGKVCSDLPAIASAKLRVTANRVGFTDVTPTNERLDSVAGNLLIRQEAVTASPEWTVTVDGEKITLRALGATKVRTLVRIDPERLRRIYAGMRASGWSAHDHWRCFLGNATAGDQAFAPLMAGRSYRRPEFLDRYLKLASYVVAIRSAVAIPPSNETDPERRKLLSVRTEELMVQPFDSIVRPPSAEDRQRFNAVLAYVDQHTRATIAFNAASANAATARARAAATAREAAGKEAVAKAATAAASAAAAKAAPVGEEHERAQATAATQAQAAKDAVAAAKEAEAVAALKQNIGVTATAAADAARRVATIQLRKARAARTYAADRQQRYDTAIRAAADQKQGIEQAKADAAEQEKKAAAGGTAAAEQQQKADAVRFDADIVLRKYESARLAAVMQQQKSALLTGSAQAFDESVSLAQKAVNDAAALLERSKAQSAAADAANSVQGGDAPAGASPSGIGEAARELAETHATLQAILQATIAAGERNKADARAAAAQAVELIKTAQAMEQQAREAIEGATAAQAVADQAKADAEAALRETARLAALARDAETRASQALESTNAIKAARDQSEEEAAAEEKLAAELNAAADGSAGKARDAQGAAQSAIAARNRAVSMAEQAAAEATRRADVVRNAAKGLTAAQEAAQFAAATAQTANAQFAAATETAAQAAAEAQAAAGAEAAAADAMKASAATQPQGGNLTAIGAADIAAFAHVIGESSDGKRLFCRGQNVSAPPIASIAVTSPARTAAPLAAAPLPPPASSLAAAAPETPPALPQARPPPPAVEPKAVKVPLPPARPSTLGR